MRPVEDAKEQFRIMSGLKKLLTVVLTLAVLALVLIPVGWMFYRTMFLTWTDNYHFVYTYNYWTGQVAAVSHNGYIYCPFYKCAVHTIDLRPMQVSMSTIQRVLNAKLVHFDPYPKDPETGLPGWQLFIKWHGRNDYEGPGNAALGSPPTTFSNLLMNYAYDGTGKVYPFLVIEKELKGDTVVIPQPSTVPKPAAAGAQQ